MAKQHGIITLSGGLDDLIHYRTKYGNITRRRGNVTTERRKKSPEFAKSRQSASEHSYASTIGKLLRRGAKETTGQEVPGDTNTRLVKAIRKVIKQHKGNAEGPGRLDSVSAPGLRGFEWDLDAPVLASLIAKYDLKMDLENGRASFGIEGFDAATMVKQYASATHVDLMLVVTAVDYEGDWEVSNFDGAGALSVAEARPMDLLLTCDIPGKTGDLIVAGLGIQMYQEVNGHMNRLKTGSGYVILAAMM